MRMLAVYVSGVLRGTGADGMATALSYVKVWPAYSGQRGVCMYRDQLNMWIRGAQKTLYSMAKNEQGWLVADSAGLGQAIGILWYAWLCRRNLSTRNRSSHLCSLCMQLRRLVVCGRASSAGVGHGRASQRRRPHPRRSGVRCVGAALLQRCAARQPPTCHDNTQQRP